MRNLKQTLIFFALVILFITGSAFAATFANPTCVPPNCNAEEPLDKSANLQTKSGGITATNFSASNTLRSHHWTILGNDDGGVGNLVVYKGSSWFNGNVSIGADGINNSTTQPNITNKLQLKGSTNIGMGDYCTLTRTQIANGATACPAGSYVSWYNPDATGSSVALRCTTISPSDNSTNSPFTPVNKGACGGISAPSLTSLASSIITGNSCDYEDNYDLTVNLSGGVTPVNTKFQSKLSTSSTWLDVGSSTISIPKIYGSIHSRTYNIRAVATDSINQTATSSTINISNTTRPGNCPA